MIRPATVDDIEAVVALWTEVVVDSFHDGTDDVRRLLVRDPDALLVAEGEQRLAAAGCRRISAVVVRDDDAAPAFWRSVGYALDPAAKRFVKNLK